MAQDTLSRFIDSFQKAFLDRRWDEVASHFTFPVVIYTTAGVKMVRTAKQLSRFTQQYREALQDRRVETTTSEITQQEPPRNHRFRVTAQFTGHGPDGTDVTFTIVRYFLVESEGTYKIEMLEYLKEPFSPPEVARILH